VSERTEISFEVALMMALRADAQKELDELPIPPQIRVSMPCSIRKPAKAP